MSLKIEVNTGSACKIEVTGDVHTIAAELLFGVSEIYASIMQNDAHLAAVFKALMQASIWLDDSHVWDGKMSGKNASLVFARFPKKDGR